MLFVGWALRCARSKKSSLLKSPNSKSASNLEQQYGLERDLVSPLAHMRISSHAQLSTQVISRDNSADLSPDRALSGDRAKTKQEQAL